MQEVLSYLRANGFKTYIMLVWVGFKNLFASRARREGLKRFAAYVLLVPK